MNADLIIIGGGLGGVSAALAALRAGHSVILTEQYAWLGGQLTSQAVTLDEHTWIEAFGSSASYRELRNGIRDYYRANYPLSAEARADAFLNPGAGLVSRLCSEPRVGVAVIEQLLAPHLSSGRLSIIQPAVPVSAETAADRVTSVTVRHLATGELTQLTGAFVLDATETGELLPLTGTEYVVGSESRAQTGEPSAPDEARADNVQAISWCFVVDHVDGDHTIERPDDYDQWAAFQPEFWGAPMIRPHRAASTHARDLHAHVHPHHRRRSVLPRRRPARGRRGQRAVDLPSHPLPQGAGAWLPRQRHRARELADDRLRRRLDHRHH